MAKISILIPTYNAEYTIFSTLMSCINQKCDKEIIVCDNGSTDRTLQIVRLFPEIKIYVNETNIGGGKSMERLMTYASDYFVFMCADDMFTNDNVCQNIIDIFNTFPKVGHVSRYYYQWITGIEGKVRVKRSNNIYSLADNPSGLAFRKQCLPLEVNNKPFIEAASIVKQVLDKGWTFVTMPFDTVRIRIGNNNSQNKTSFLESPLLNWVNLIGKQYFILTSFISLIQIRCWGGYNFLLREIFYFIKFRPINLLRIDFWFFSLITLLIPKKILIALSKFYKHKINRFLLKGVK